MTSLAVRPTTTAERVEQGSPFGFVGDGARHPLAERPAVRCEGHPGTRGDEFVDPIGWQLDDRLPVPRSTQAKKLPFIRRHGNPIIVCG
jgi:hypothetical protein